MSGREALSDKIEAEIRAELEKNPELKPKDFLKLKPEYRKCSKRVLVYRIFKRIKEAGKPEAEAVEPEPEITVSKEQPIEFPNVEEAKGAEGLEPDVQARLERIAGKAMDRLLGLMDKAMKLHEKAGMAKEDLEDSGFLIMAMLTKYAPTLGSYQVETVAGLHFGSLIIDKIITWKLKRAEEEAKEKKEKSESQPQPSPEPSKSELSTPKKPRTKEEAGIPAWAKGE